MPPHFTSLYTLLLLLLDNPFIYISITLPVSATTTTITKEEIEINNNNNNHNIQVKRKLFTLGLVADNHYDTFPAGEKAPWQNMQSWLHTQHHRTTTTTQRRYDIAKDKMDEAILLFNQIPDMNMIVNLGDLVNNDLMWNLKPILESFHKAKVPHYSILGNHDLRAHNDRFGKINKTQEKWLMQKLGLKRWYYAIDHPPFHFIFIDSMTNDPENKNITTKEAQTQWLKEELDLAKTLNRVSIIFAHVPIGFETNRLGALLKQYDQIALIFSGHNHKGNYVIQGPHHVHCVTLAGQIETLTNAFAVVEIFEDSAELTGFGRVPSRILPFQLPVIKLLQSYKGPLKHNLESQGCQPPPVDKLWENEILQKPPNLLLNIPNYRKPNVPRSIIQSNSKTRFYNEVYPLILKEGKLNKYIRGPEEIVDLTSATGKSTFLVNGINIITDIKKNNIKEEYIKKINVTSLIIEKKNIENDFIQQQQENEIFINFILLIPIIVILILLFWTFKRRRRIIKQRRERIYTY